MNEIREAIMQAADQVERYPETFDFNATMRPRSRSGCRPCGRPWLRARVGRVLSRVGGNGFILILPRMRSR